MKKIIRMGTLYFVIGAAVAGGCWLFPETRWAMLGAVYLGVILLTVLFPSIGDSGPLGPPAAYLASAFVLAVLIGMIVHSAARLAHSLRRRREPSEAERLQRD